MTVAEAVLSQLYSAPHSIAPSHAEQRTENTRTEHRTAATFLCPGQPAHYTLHMSPLVFPKFDIYDVDIRNNIWR